MNKSMLPRNAMHVYRGIGAPLAGNMPFWGSYYLGYHLAKKYIAWGNNESMASQIVVGVSAGVFSCSTMTPIDAVKVTAQIDGISTLAAVRKLLKRGGVAEFYRPLLPTVARMGPASAVYFCTHDSAKSRGLSPFVCGGLAGVFEWAFVMPVDTVKTRYTMAKAGTSIFDVIKTTAREGGFYKGILPTMTRAFPANGAAFLAIDVSEKYMRDF